MQDTLIIDVREPSEFNDYHIPNSVNAPRSSHGQKELEDIIKQSKAKKIILMCVSGRRAEAAKSDIKNTFNSTITVYNGGIGRWQMENKTEKEKPMMSIHRQVNIFYSLILLISLILFNIVPIATTFIISLLIIDFLKSGVKDTEPLITQLIKDMAWNKK